MSSHAPSSVTSGMKVLVVDDDPIIRTMHTAILERAGFVVDAVEDGRVALDALEGGEVELVLLDSRMPGMSGIEVLSELRAAGSSLPVILVTGARETHDRVEGLESGADDYITKPVDARELVARVRALVRGRQAAVDAQAANGSGDLAVRRALVEIVESRSFHAVFQPIIELGSRSVVAYEALTRFDDGCRPDIRFGEAERVGLGAELALATLAASIDAATDLPSGVPLHLNVAPQLLSDPSLSTLLKSADRPVVVELTEHDPIEDYDDATARIDALGDDVRLAIDDAGAGYSSMTHVLALRPQEVKLDREWVRGVDADVARQALIAGLVTFATTTGTTLVAEGVETEAEASMLTDLGVAHAQGYHFGRPAPAGESGRSDG